MVKSESFDKSSLVMYLIKGFNDLIKADESDHLLGAQLSF